MSPLSPDHLSISMKNPGTSHSFVSSGVGIFSVFHETAHIFVTLSKPSSLVRRGIRCGFREHLGNFLIGLWISWSGVRHRQSALISLSATGAQVHTNNTQGKWSKMSTNAPVYARKESCGEIGKCEFHLQSEFFFLKRGYFSWSSRL